MKTSSAGVECNSCREINFPAQFVSEGGPTLLENHQETPMQ